MEKNYILCYKNQGIHWYPCHPTFLWKINFTLVRRLILALNWDISGQWNHSDGRDYRQKRIVISRFLTTKNRPYAHRNWIFWQNLLKGTEDEYFIIKWLFRFLNNWYQIFSKLYQALTIYQCFGLESVHNNLVWKIR